MKVWKKPELWVMDASCTEAGGKGGNGDGVYYKIAGEIVIGTSGPPLPPPFEPVGP